MIDDYWGINCRSQNSAGKRAIKIQYFRRAIIPRKYAEVPILPDAGGSQKERPGWATMGLDKAQARAPCWPRLGCVWPPWPTSDGDPSRISSPRKPKVEESVQRNIPPPLRGGKHQREKSSPADRNLPGEIPSRRGKSTPSSPPSSWTSSGSSSSSSPPSAPSSPPSPPRPAVTIWVATCLVHRGNFPGIDYYLYLMLLSETIGLRFMSRLLFIIISSLILIHMMSRE